MIRQEMAQDAAASRYRLSPTNQHAHTGTDSPQIQQGDILLSSRANGNITMATANQTYTFLLSDGFAPSLIFFYGGAYHTGGGGPDIRSSVQGSAQLSNALYFQPSTDSSVQSGGLNGLIVQSSSSFTIDSTAATPVAHLVVGEGHIVDVATPTASDIVARATVTAVSATGITVYTDTLAAGWTIQGNWVVI